MNRPPLNARIRFTYWPFNEATVTEHSIRGFHYVYDRPIPHGRAAWGMQAIGGEIFCDLDWRKWDADIEVMENDYSI